MSSYNMTQNDRLSEKSKSNLNYGKTTSNSNSSKIQLINQK